jgi:Concanavalin A-like lectin/glucanases superfamily
LEISVASVNLLINGEDPNNATTAIDSSGLGRHLTATGSAKVSTGQSKFGLGSLFFDGTANAAFVGPVGNNFGVMDSTTYQLELWVYRAAANTNSQRLLQFADGDNYAGISLGINSAGNLECYAATESNAWKVALTNIVGIVLNTWTHIAVTRLSSTLKVYVNGTLSASAFLYGAPYQATPRLIVGGQTSGVNRSFSGYIDDLRISDFPTYFENFSPPTAQLTNSLGLPALGAAAVTGLYRTLSNGAQGNQPGPPGARAWRDMYRPMLIDGAYLGNASITGPVTVQNTVAPFKQVRLYDKVTGRLMAQTRSAANGSYSFANIDSRREYFVVAHDETRTFNAVISDMIQP